MGSATRSTIRSFQKSRGLTVDGKVRPATAAALKAALGASPGPSPVPAPSLPLPAAGLACTRPRLANARTIFDFDKDQLKSGHRQQIRRIAQRIFWHSHRSCRPIRRVQLIGHVVLVGPVSYNLGVLLAAGPNRSAANWSSAGRVAARLVRTTGFSTLPGGKPRRSW